MVISSQCSLFGIIAAPYDCYKSIQMYAEKISNLMCIGNSLQPIDSISLLHHLQIRFRHLDACRQNTGYADDHIGSVCHRGDFALNAGELAFDNRNLLADGERFGIQANSVRVQVHHEHEVLHLLVRDYQHGMGVQIFHIEDLDAINIVYVTGRLLGGMDKDQPAEHRNHTAFPTIFQLCDYRMSRKIALHLHPLLRTQLFDALLYCKFLLTQGAGCKPILLCVNHL